MTHCLQSVVSVHHQTSARSTPAYVDVCTLYSEEIPTARYLTYGEIANISQYIFNFLVSRVSNSGNYIIDEESNYTYSVGNISYIFIKPVKPIFLSIFFLF